MQTADWNGLLGEHVFSDEMYLQHDVVVCRYCGDWMECYARPGSCTEHVRRGFITMWTETHPELPLPPLAEWVPVDQRKELVNAGMSNGMFWHNPGL